IITSRNDHPAPCSKKYRSLHIDYLEAFLQSILHNSRAVKKVTGALKQARPLSFVALTDSPARQAFALRVRLH
ncbi:MAG: hypothetical protein QM636_17015, partial [Rhizobium sp.]